MIRISLNPLTLWAILGLCLAGCATPGNDITLSAVSTDKTFRPSTNMGHKVGLANERFCASDESPLERIGYIDRLVQKALSKTKATYIANAKFFSTDKECVQMTGDLVLVDPTDAPTRAVASLNSDGRPLMEVVGIFDQMVEIALKENTVVAQQKFNVINPSGEPLGVVQIEKVGPTFATGKLVTGKAFFGWKLAPPEAP